MSVIFGMKKTAEDVIELRQLASLAMATSRYAPDGVFVEAKGHVGMGLQPYFTHQRSKFESHPTVDPRGNMLTFDGRLDNYRELCHLLDLQSHGTSDSQIILAAFERWGEGCFSRFVGEWALALWSKADDDLYLARDHAGTRTLYFEQANGRVLWSTYLETFFVERETRDLNEGFAACYLGCQPIRSLTPYRGIEAVPPAHYLRFHEGGIVCKAHWQWMVADKIHYDTDAEYDEHFLALFGKAVERRTGPGAPILAQLSGGMDSSSIVCMSDHLRRVNDPAADLLDTISFYDDSERSWDERPYFNLVEAGRGKTGIHLETSFRDLTFCLSDQSRQPRLLPGDDGSTSKREERFQNAVRDRQYRAVLSGVGGDEVLGGAPTGTSELADYLVAGRIDILFSRSMQWCLAERVPLIHKLFETGKFALSVYQSPHRSAQTMPPWLRPRLAIEIKDRQRCDQVAKDRFHCAPSSIGNGLTWWAILESLPTLRPASLVRYEYRYPYLDRDLIDFLFRIPREQLVRPGRRRLMMRRALAPILPREIVERRRKAFVIRGPLEALRAAQAQIPRLFREGQGHESVIDVVKLGEALNQMIEGKSLRWIHPMFRAVSFQLWLSQLARHGTITIPSTPLSVPRQSKIRGRLAAEPGVRGNSKQRGDHYAIYETSNPE